jgi:hypothetical protein
MSLPSVTCTAVHVDPPLTRDPTPPPGPVAKRRGNPNLSLAPRCGARTRSGCPCGAPAIRGKLRCRMHGGRSTGPRTAAGRARVAAARTIHGRYGAEARAHDRFILGFARYGRVFRAALRYSDHLPPDFAAQLRQDPLVLAAPPYPTGGLTAAEDRAMQRAEGEALAPWKRAIACAKSANRRAMVVQAEASPSAPLVAAEAHVPVQDAGAAPLPGAGRSDVATAAGEAHAPEQEGAAARLLGAGRGDGGAATAEAHAPVEPSWAPPHAPAATAGAAAKPHAPEHNRPARNQAASFPQPAASRAATLVRAKPHAPEQATPLPGLAAAIHPGAPMRPSLREQLQASSLFDCLPTITRLASYSNAALMRDATPIPIGRHRGRP